jgi:ribosomal protein L35AE/L33A
LALTAVLHPLFSYSRTLAVSDPLAVLVKENDITQPGATAIYVAGALSHAYKKQVPHVQICAGGQVTAIPISTDMKLRAKSLMLDLE